MRLRMSVAAAVLAMCITVTASLAAGPYTVEARVFFSPRGGAEQAVVEAIDGARESVRVQAYELTNERIAWALWRAARRPRVRVQVLVDDNNETDRYSFAWWLLSEGVSLRTDSGGSGIAHNKVVLVDAGTTVTGSFNFTAAAEERNVENLLVLTSEGLAREYHARFDERAQRSRPFVWKGRLFAPRVPRGGP